MLSPVLPMMMMNYFGEDDELFWKLAFST